MTAPRSTEVAAPAYPVVLFDLDGTLTDPKLGITRGVQHALAGLGIRVDDLDELVPYIGPPIQDGLRLHHGVAGDDIDRAVGWYREYLAAGGLYENAVIPGVPDLLVELRAAGAVLSVATSKPTGLAMQILEHFGLAEHFVFVGGATLDGRRRAKVDVIDHVLAVMGIDAATSGPDRVVIVGDREHDVLGAHAAGIASIGVRWGYAEPGELESARPTAIADTVTDLTALLLCAP